MLVRVEFCCLLLFGVGFSRPQNGSFNMKRDSKPENFAKHSSETINSEKKTSKKEKWETQVQTQLVKNPKEYRRAIAVQSKTSQGDHQAIKKGNFDESFQVVSQPKQSKVLRSKRSPVFHTVFTHGSMRPVAQIDTQRFGSGLNSFEVMPSFFSSSQSQASASASQSSKFGTIQGSLFPSEPSFTASSQFIPIQSLPVQPAWLRPTSFSQHKPSSQQSFNFEKGQGSLEPFSLPMAEAQASAQASAQSGAQATAQASAIVNIRPPSSAEKLAINHGFLVSQDQLGMSQPVTLLGNQEVSSEFQAPVHRFPVNSNKPTHSFSTVFSQSSKDNKPIWMTSMSSESVGASGTGNQKQSSLESPTIQIGMPSSDTNAMIQQEGFLSVIQSGSKPSGFPNAGKIEGLEAQSMIPKHSLFQSQNLALSNSISTNKDESSIINLDSNAKPTNSDIRKPNEPAIPSAMPQRSPPPLFVMQNSFVEDDSFQTVRPSGSSGSDNSNSALSEGTAISQPSAVKQQAMSPQGHLAFGSNNQVQHQNLINQIIQANTNNEMNNKKHVELMAQIHQQNLLANENAIKQQNTINSVATASFMNNVSPQQANKSHNNLNINKQNNHGNLAGSVFPSQSTLTSNDKRPTVMGSKNPVDNSQTTKDGTMPPSKGSAFSNFENLSNSQRHPQFALNSNQDLESISNMNSQNTNFVSQNNNNNNKLHNVNFQNQANGISSSNAIKQQNTLAQNNQISSINEINHQNQINQNNNINQGNHINSGNVIGNNHDIRQQNTITHNSGINSANAINQHNQVNQNNKINELNVINSSNGIQKQNSISQNNNIEQTNKIQQSNSISSVNEINQQNSITQNNVIQQDNNINQENRITSSNKINQQNSINQNNEIGQNNNIQQGPSINSANFVAPPHHKIVHFAQNPGATHFATIESG
ncbi:hypothetical protein QYM36_010739 [Artemia franciscana]|uniref:Uncharacterized protein n=2 Tax=Artemia franciscana TaxID=6661 RepID=A0AA88I179_ARTSF|nr:hypothetical protein QYM36_010739 [Artemia franciscana]